MTDGAPTSLPATTSESSTSQSNTHHTHHHTHAHAHSHTQPHATGHAQSRQDDQKPSSPHQLLLHATQAVAATGLLNKHNASSNASIDFSFLPLGSNVSHSPSPPPPPPSRFPGASSVQFRTETIAPSPPQAESPSPSETPRRRRSDPTIVDDDQTAGTRYQPSPLRGDSHAYFLPPQPHTDAFATLAEGLVRRDSHNSSHSSGQHSSANLSATTPSRPSALSLQHKTSWSSLRPGSRTPSFKASLGAGFGTASGASSTYPSPIISAMGDVTPLPSPLLSSDSPGPWRRLGGRPPSRDATHSPTLAPIPSESVLVSSTGESIASALAHQSKRKGYASLGAESSGEGAAATANGNGNGNDNGRNMSTSSSSSSLLSAEKKAVPHTRNRSVSEYTPDPMLLPKRMLTVSGSGRGASKAVGSETLQLEMQQKQQHMRREPHLSAARGLTPVERPPTPPPSESSLSSVADLSSSSSASVSGISAAGSASTTAASETLTPSFAPARKKPRYEYFEAHRRSDGKLRRWRAIKLLGQGTFSRVMLATSSPPRPDEEENDDDQDGGHDQDDGPDADSHYTHGGQHQGQGHHSRRGEGHQRHHRHEYDRKTLVAVKVCEHGPKGGASEDRVEMSLKRELEIMQSIRHPSLVHLRAWNIEPTRAILVLSYCPGGDLFDVATAHRDVLSPGLMKRIFAELVGAVRYLHERRIVHRDIKLENVLVNLPPSELADPSQDWTMYPYPISTLTDLGLSRRVSSDDEKLETRCGSDDYAAPEVIMGQPYDGRATDAWSLGVLLYALLESRLPFDPLPGTTLGPNMRSRTSHRIARVEWRWVAFAGDDGDHEGDEALFASKGLLGAMEITEGLLKRARSRWPLEKVAGTEWVRDGIRVEGGARFREEDEGGDI